MSDGGPYSPYIQDSSGNNNQLRTFSTNNPDTRPRWTSNVSSGKTAIWNIQGPSMSAGKLREHALKLALRAARAEALVIPAAYFCSHSGL